LTVDTGGGIAARFSWHPEYSGRTLFDVRDDITREIAADQRAWTLALEGAEEHEADSLATVMRLEKKWSEFDLGWAEAEPGDLADRILQWEWERERRQELFPYSEMRPASPPEAVPPAQPAFLEWLRRLFNGGRGHD
jgi:hypothetical protein